VLKGSSSSSSGREYFSILRRRKGDSGGAKSGLLTGSEGDVGFEVGSCGSIAILGIVSSKSNNSSIQD
jgi:hypothetical protein